MRSLLGVIKQIIIEIKILIKTEEDPDIYIRRMSEKYKMKPSDIERIYKNNIN